MRKVNISNITHPLISPLTVEICETLMSQFMGLMFRTNLPPEEGILLVEAEESRVSTAIHMFFMNFDIVVVWINSANTIVDLKLARRWTFAHISNVPAKKTLEIHPSRLAEFVIGDQLIIENA